MPKTAHTPAELSFAFDVVKNDEHWKGRINKVVTVQLEGWEKVRDLIADAVEFYTATEATITVERACDRVHLHVEALGYWEGPAN